MQCDVSTRVARCCPNPYPGPPYRRDRLYMEPSSTYQSRKLCNCSFHQQCTCTSSAPPLPPLIDQGVRKRLRLFSISMRMGVGERGRWLGGRIAGELRVRRLIGIRIGDCYSDSDNDDDTQAVWEIGSMACRGGRWRGVGSEGILEYGCCYSMYNSRRLVVQAAETTSCASHHNLPHIPSLPTPLPYPQATPQFSPKQAHHAVDPTCNNPRRSTPPSPQKPSPDQSPRKTQSPAKPACRVYPAQCLRDLGRCARGPENAGA